MPEWIMQLLGAIPLACLEPAFMRQALLALLLLTPMTGMLGLGIVNFRMAFFSDAVGHSAFAGLAVGLALALPPRPVMLGFGLLTGLAIVLLRHKSRLSSDTSIGIVFSAVVALGLACLSRNSGMGRGMQQFLLGDILTLSPQETGWLALLLLATVIFHLVAHNRLLLLALSPELARVQGIRASLWHGCFAGLLSLVVMFSVWTVGVLLVTALLIVPAATARNMARSDRGMFWWAIAASMASGVGGLILSAQPWLATASGPTIILVACTLFILSCLHIEGNRQ